MKFTRMIAAAAVVALAGVGGMFALAPELHGQAKRDRDRRAVVLAGQDHGALVRLRGRRAADWRPGPGRGGVRRHETEARGSGGRGDRTGRQRDAGGEGGLEGRRRGGRVRRRTGPERASARSAGRGNAAGTQREDVHRARYGEAGCRRHARDAGIRRRDAAHARSDADADSFSFKRDLDSGRMGDEIRDSLRNRKFERFAVPSFEFDWDGSDVPVDLGRRRGGGWA